MLFRLLADAVLLLHLSFIAFALLGGLLVLRRPAMAWLHLPALAWGVWIEMTGGICPLTPLENTLRRWGGEAAYAGDFIERYLVSWIYPAGLTRELQWVLAAALVIINLIIYTMVWRRRKRRG